MKCEISECRIVPLFNVLLQPFLPCELLQTKLTNQVLQLILSVVVVVVTLEVNQIVSTNIELD